MTKKTPKPYLIIFAAMLLLMSIPMQTSEKLRGLTIAGLAPVWNILAQIQHSLFGFFSRPSTENGSNQQLQYLQLENHMLTQEIQRLQQLFEHERYLSTQLTTLPKNMRRTEEMAQLVQRSQLQAKQCLAFQLKAIPAQVIFRSPSAWSGTLWLNVGNADNPSQDDVVIAKNSPVLVGSSIIGVVDYVGQHQCRVRLITDSALTPSVRAARGDLQKCLLIENMTLLSDRLALHPKLLPAGEDTAKFVDLLHKMQCNLVLGQEKPSWYLAKGELHGSSQPLWRSRGNLLRGIGFNYDFADEEGPARDLRSGQAIPDDSEIEALPIIKVNDILVTTGMDGIFPPGLPVAEVTKVHSLKEGDYYYEIEARPTAGNLNELSVVFIIPALNYNAADQPPLIH